MIDEAIEGRGYRILHGITDHSNDAPVPFPAFGQFGEVNRFEIDDGGAGRPAERLFCLGTCDHSAGGRDAASVAPGQCDSPGGGRRRDSASLIDHFVNDHNAPRSQIRNESTGQSNENDWAGVLAVAVGPSRPGPQTSSRSAGIPAAARIFRA